MITRSIRKFSSHRLWRGLVAAVILIAGTGCGGAPSNRTVGKFIAETFGSSFRITELSRFDGAEVHGTVGPQTYKVLYTATLIPRAPLTLLYEGGMTNAQIKSILGPAAGEEPRRLINVYRGHGPLRAYNASYVYRDGTQPIAVMFLLTFTKSESGWVPEETRVMLEAKQLDDGKEAELPF